MAFRTPFPARLSREEAVGLIVAAVAHAGLLAWLALDPPGKMIAPPPERMTVTLSDDVATQATMPELPPPPAYDEAAQFGETVIEPAPPGEVELIPPAPGEELEVPIPPAARPLPRPAPPKAEPPPAPDAKRPNKPKAADKPKVISKPKPKPAAKPATKVAAKASSSAKAAADGSGKPAAKGGKGQAASKQASADAGKAGAKDQRERRRPDAPSGKSRIGSDFLKGVPGEQATAKAPAAPAVAGPQVAASLRQAVARQLKPHWVAPQGAEADKLVTILRFQLSRDGRLAAWPTVVSQSGVTDANKAQKARHAEQAIRAVQLAVPFDLPTEHYDSWRSVTSRFDRKLSQ